RVERRDHALDLHAASGLVDGRLRHGGDVNVGINAAGDADAAPAGGLGGLPGKLFGDGFEGAAHARVGEKAEAELKRVHAGLGGQNVDVRFVREGVGVGGGRAPGANAERVH